MTVEVFNCEQNSDEWLELRRGIVTASEIGTVMASGRKKGEPSVTRHRYMMSLAAERLGAQPAEAYTNAHMARGHAMESEARALYALLADEEPKLVGFIRNGDKGASPDALVGDNGLLEIKTKLPHLQVDLLLSNKVPEEHLPQIQGQLWIAEREFVDFVSYWPGLEHFRKRVFRDEAHIAEIAKAVEIFNDELAATVERIRNHGRPLKDSLRLSVASPVWSEEATNIISAG